MNWSQTYDPLGHLGLSALVASLPVVLLLLLLAAFHVRAHWAALAGLVSAMLIAILVFGMPTQLALSSAVYGAMFGLFPIGWIVVCAIFIYEITVETGQFEVLRRKIATLTDDRRLQVLLIAFSFGAFIEGAAGFGAPVAISAAMLIGLGFRALPAAGLALIGNTAPVAFGALGTPVIALANVTGLPLDQLSQMIGRQLPVFSLMIPFWLIGSMVGWREMLKVWPACLTAGLSFGSVQFAVSNYHGPWLVDIAGSIASILALVLLLRFWQPPPLPDDKLVCLVPEPALASTENLAPATGSTLRALLPWIVLTVMVSLWGIPQIQNELNRATYKFTISSLHQQVQRVPPVVAQPTSESAEFKLNSLSATGTALLFTGFISGICLGLSGRRLVSIFLRTLRRTALSLVTIAAMLALGYTTRFSGLDATMGLAMASTGWLFPFFSPMLGWLGVALTGSDTSSNILFGNLQQISAERLGVSPLLAAASNSSGGVMGKMIDAQSIVVAGVATGQHGQEGNILRYVFLHSLILAMLVGVLVMVQAYGMPWIIPV
ncbi:MAG: L-lactate permease [Pirellulaceae bacterium]|nr:L-lactate permease [Pirellulaceae bacterium]